MFVCDQKTIFEFEKEWVQATGANLNTNLPVRKKETVQEYNKEYSKNNVQIKRYYCEICDLACRSSSDLKKHLGTLKHSYAWLNAVD